MEVEHLENMNKEKKYLIMKLTEESEAFKEKLNQSEMDIEKLRVNSQRVECPEANDPLNLFEELENVPENIHFISKFSCETCKKSFANKLTLEKHKKKCMNNNCWSQKISELQLEIFGQRTNLAKQIGGIKENEIHEQYSCNSNCSAGCRIFHQKHNYVKSVAKRMFEKLNQIRINENRCEQCEKSFCRLEDLEKHIKTAHTVHQCEELIIDDQHLGVAKSVCESLEESFDDDFEDYIASSHKQLSNICLLSFTSGDELRKHQPKHTNVRAPSILKKF